MGWGWSVLAVGVAVGACLVLVLGRVRDAVLDVVDAVDRWWWDLVDRIRLFVYWVVTLVLVGLSTWAIAELLLPRLAEM